MAAERVSSPHNHVVGDSVGQALSLICIIHCLAAPFVLAAMPTLSHFMGGFHPVLLVFVVGTALWAFIPGYKHHRRPSIIVAALVGVTLLTLATLLFEGDVLMESALTIPGAAVLMWAHWKNRRCVHDAHAHHGHSH
ncbi:MAG: MerC domain-containing protein [Myxococcaceae bacterium]|nr:MerC domain-containing protein [Myxococcaceae bacterium]